MPHENPPHVLTIDIEDWFHCLEPIVENWDRFSRRIDVETDFLLGLLEKHKAKATFFVLGDVARHHPETIKDIASQGHEIGTHGMFHRLVYNQTQQDFRDDLRRSLDILTSLTGEGIRSYRAPYFSITSQSLWALDILRQEGIEYDSSIFASYNWRYGIPHAERTPHQTESGLWEWPISTVPTVFGNIPFAGGAYFRLLPWKFVYVAVKIVEKRNEPIVMYLHPWELDPDQPRFKTDSWFLNFRHYYGLAKTAKKLEKLLAGANYTTLVSAAQTYESEVL